MLVFGNRLLFSPGFPGLFFRFANKKLSTSDFYDSVVGFYCRVVLYIKMENYLMLFHVFFKIMLDKVASLVVE